MRVLVAEDDITSATLLQGFLTNLGYEVAVANDGCQAYEMICKQDYRMVISDWQMPEMDGVELCRKIRERHLGAYVYIILLTCRGGSDNLIEGLRAGADDFMTKPFQPEELRVRLHVGQRINALESRDLVIFSLAKLAESRDPETGAHLERIREYVRTLADELSYHPLFHDIIDADYIRAMYQTSPLHDIGKVGVPDEVLLKPDKLDEREAEIMKQHTVVGAQTLDAALAAHPQAGFLRFARDIAWSHHERYDGTGYPLGLSGEEIPLCGRITAVADVYDALTTKRVYKPAFSHEKSKRIIVEGSGTQFDPRIVDAFLAREADFIRIKEQLSDEPQDRPFLAANPDDSAMALA
jgi:putative two-component system response regulator